MAKYVNQVRYYGDSAAKTKNSPDNVTYRTLQSGAVFESTMPIVQLGIQTLPGMKFYINEHPNPIIVGQTGIYELNVDGISYITKLRFDGQTLSTINNNSNTAYLIIDYIYEKED